MSIMFINSDTLSDIADAIRAKTGGSGTMTPLEMPTEIASIGGGGIDISEYTERGGSIRNGSTSNTMSLDITKDYIIIGYVRLTSTKNISSCGVTLASDGNIEVLINNYAQSGTQMPWFYLVHVTGATSFTATINMSPSETGISAFYKP